MRRERSDPYSWGNIRPVLENIQPGTTNPTEIEQVLNNVGVAFYQNERKHGEMSLIISFQDLLKKSERPELTLYIFNLLKKCQIPVGIINNTHDESRKHSRIFIIPTAYENLAIECLKSYSPNEEDRSNIYGGVKAFSTMDPERLKKIRSEGGTNAHKKGVAHEFTPEEAREAGKKGGAKTSENKDHMREIGRIGGKNSRGGGRRRRSLGKAYVEED